MKTILAILAITVSFNLAIADSIGIEIKLSYVQKTENVFWLKTTVVDVDDEPVSGLELNFVVTVNGEQIDLGNAVTDAAGNCTYVGKLSDLRSKGHQFTFTTTFRGTDEYDQSETEIEITDASLSLKTEVIDSANTVFVALTVWNAANESVPVSDEEIKIFVPRMYSLLPITDAYTNESGEDEVEFPNDIPSGKMSELILIGRLDEHESFGTIETQTATDWGIPLAQNPDRLPRALWSPDAPLWMVITFIILMSGVWGHYFFIVFNLFRIKKIEVENSPIIYTE